MPRLFSAAALALTLMLPLLLSCSIFDREEMQAAYVQVDGFTLADVTGTVPKTDVEITEVWAYMDGKYLGTFGLPARFPVPVSENDNRQLQLYPGVHADRILQQRIQYQFYDPDSTLRGLRPGQTYRFAPAKGRIIKDLLDPSRFSQNFEFDNSGLSLDLAGTLPIERVLHGSDAPPPEGGRYYGRRRFSGVTSSEFLNIYQTTPLPLVQPVLPLFLECRYRCTVPMAIGLRASDNKDARITTGKTYPQLVLNPSPGWKKVYVYLYEEASAAVGDGYTKFQIAFVTDSATKATDYIALDNIALKEFKP